MMAQTRLLALLSGVAFAAVSATAAQAQFAPSGMEVDASNPSSGTRTTISPGGIYKIVDHYYYDCLKKKWVWVSREWSAKSTAAFGSEEFKPVGTPAGGTASPDVKQLPSGPPPGAETSAGDPGHAFNPTTGQNFAKEPDGSWIDVKTGKTAVAPKLCPPCPEPKTTTPPSQPSTPPPPKTPKGAENTICPEKRRTATLQPLKAFDQRILDVHNAERAAVGAPPLEWNPTLAIDATGWAQQLARTGQLVHAPREGRGIERENLSEGNLWWTTDQMMNNWLGEKRYFHPGIFPNVCSSGDWSQCAHYSQMIWPTTTDLGCGEATGSGHTWLVCRYSPGGNKDGKAVGEPVQIAQGPCVERRGLPERG
jgi:hypothetical protein